MKLNREEIKEILAGRSRQQITWFAARAALRVLPWVISRDNEFNREFRKPIHLIEIMQAMNVALLQANIQQEFEILDREFRRNAYTYNYTDPFTDADAYAAALAAAATDFDAADTDAAAYAAAYAAADAADAAVADNDAYATAAAAYTAADFAAAATDFDAAAAEIIKDIDAIKHKGLKEFIMWSPLWSEENANFIELEELFLDWLRKEGVAEVWEPVYRGWINGQFDHGWMYRCLRMPLSITKDAQAMLDYLSSKPYRPGSEITDDSTSRMYATRVLVLGDGNVGKTTLVKRLLGEALPMENEPATPRIEIKDETWRVPVQTSATDQNQTTEQDVRVHFWDFGGQVIMHATHQFFLREQCVYLVLINIRETDQAEKLRYWLEHVRIFGGETAPVLVVFNKIDEVPSGANTEPEFDPAEMLRQYPAIRDFIFVSAKENIKIEELGKKLKTLIGSRQVLGEGLPQHWVKLNEVLQAQYEQGHDVLEESAVLALAQENKIDVGEGYGALNALDLLGTAVRFKDLRLRRVVLNPGWITKAIYFITWECERLGLGGRLSREIVRGFFVQPDLEKLDVKVKPEDADFLLELMLAFKLAFRVKGGSGYVLSPMLASPKVPQHGVSKEGALRCCFVFDTLLPAGLFYRFVADSAGEVRGEMIWRNGAVLTNYGSTALVEMDRGQRMIEFYLQGGNAGEYLQMLRLRMLGLLRGESKETDDSALERDHRKAYRALDFQVLAYAKGKVYLWGQVLDAFSESPDAMVRPYKGGGEDEAHDVIFSGMPKNFVDSPTEVEAAYQRLKQENELLQKSHDGIKDELLLLKGEKAGLKEAFGWIEKIEKAKPATEFKSSSSIGDINLSANAAGGTATGGAGGQANASGGNANSNAEAKAEAKAEVEVEIDVQISITVDMEFILGDLLQFARKHPIVPPDRTRDFMEDTEQLRADLRDYQHALELSNMRITEKASRIRKERMLERVKKGWDKVYNLIDKGNTLIDAGGKLTEWWNNPQVQTVINEFTTKILNNFL